MARIGSFMGPTEIYSAPINSIHPTDNNFTKGRFHQLLLDPKLKLTESEMMDAQQQILELMAVLKLARDQAP